MENIEDQPIWKHSSTGLFTISSAWEHLRDCNPLDPLHQVIWYAGYIPRQSFTLWLTSQTRLPTLDRLRRMGITENMCCVLCNQEEETHTHLFFQCSYSKAVWESVSSKGTIRWPNEPWYQLMQWASSHITGKKNIHHHIARTALSTAVYYIWYKRNSRTFKGSHRTVHALGAEIIGLIRSHLMHGTIKCLVTDTVRATWNIQDDDPTVTGIY
ncbi:hypothetical protein OIU85_016915 [Salix viminalis]|uniref:Reverse transcriptase zinc-binding domain-containing protein n=1 Tax=Salix viminalis TaxID=40686 RepID=A0A9Q0V708_SALVM|nr:hypothetical protein OIU85_016915 [Salix viminalis]